MVRRGFSRIPYFISFLLKLVVVALFFIINGIFAAETRLSESVSFYENEAVLVETQNTGTCIYNQSSIGAINLSVGTNERPSDVVIKVTVNNINYDDSYDREVIGDNIDQYQDLLPSKDGPWDLCFRFAIENKSANSIADDAKYYEVNFADKTYAAEIVGNGSADRTETDLVTVNKGDSLTLTINLGSQTHNSVVPQGEYCLHIALSRGELVGSEAIEKLGGLGRIIKLGFLSYRHALFNIEVSDIFNFNNIVGIILLLYSIGTAIYFYPDIKSTKQFYNDQFSDVYCGPPVVIKKTFRDPYTGVTYTTTETECSGPSIVLVLLKTTLYFVLLVVLVPIRFFVYMVKDLLLAITGKKPYSVFYGLGCFIGSFGLWLILGSLPFFLATNWIAGGILAGVGVGALIGARFLANDDFLTDEDD